MCKASTTLSSPVFRRKLAIPKCVINHPPVYLTAGKGGIAKPWRPAWMPAVRWSQAEA